MQLPDFEQIFDALPSPYMVLDRGLNYVRTNSAYEEATMRSREDLLGRNIFDLFPNDGESGQRLRESFERVFATGETDTIAYIPYDIPRPPEKGGGVETRFWTAVHSPLIGDDGTVQFLMQNTVDVTNLVRLREAASLPFRVEEMRLLERAREAEEQHQSLLSESEDFRRLFQMAPGFFAVVDGPDHVFTFANDAYRRLVGGRNVVGKPISEALPEIVGQGFIDILDSVYRTGKPAGGQAQRVMLRQSPAEPPHEMFLDFSYDAIRDSQGTITGIFVQGMDRTDAVRTQRHQRLLLDELNHRVKNTLSTVQTLTSQTLRSAPDLKTASADIEARLVALSGAHNLLSMQTWANADLADIAKQEFLAHDEDRVKIDGPSVTLAPKTAIVVALVLHELSTNSVKHGSLSTDGGRVFLNWDVEESNSDLCLHWSEKGGPPVTGPVKRGFGTRMINQAVTAEMGGSIQLDFNGTGFSCGIEIPSEAWQTGNEHAVGG